MNATKRFCSPLCLILFANGLLIGLKVINLDVNLNSSQISIIIVKMLWSLWKDTDHFLHNLSL